MRTVKQAALPAPLAYRHRRLANGLDVYALRDDTTINVAVQVWYRVGARDDPHGRSGFAHLFEHLMFKATRQMPSEYIDRLTEDIGGYNNASTYADFTNYYEVVPANHLHRLLWAEASRMGSLVIDDDGFQTERDVVKEELRDYVFAAPYGRLFENFLSYANYDVHPYGRPVIGSIDDLNEATLADVRQFHRTYYRPDNAILVISGRFDDVALDRSVDQFFGPIPAPATAIPRAAAHEPRRSAPRRLTTTGPSVPLPAVTLSFPGVYASMDDLAAIIMLEAILARGDSARLHKSLVYDQAIASEIFTMVEPTLDASPFTIGAILSDGVSLTEGEAALNAVIADITRAGVRETDLARVRSELLTEKLEARETAFGRGFELAESVMRFGRPDGADTLLRQLNEIGKDAVNAAARTLFAPESAVIIHYEDESACAKKTDRLRQSDTIAAVALAHEEQEQEGDDQKAEREAGDGAPRATLPENAPAPEHFHKPSLPTIEDMQLANGLRLVVAEQKGTGLVNAVLRVPAGAIRDPQAMWGIAEQTAALSLRGAGGRDAMTFADAAALLGVTITTGTDYDTAYASLFARSDRLESGLSLLGHLVIDPHLADDEWAKLRRLALDEHTVALAEPSYRAARALARLLFAGHPYGASMTAASLNAIAGDDIRRFHAQFWRPDEAVMTLIGDIDPRTAHDLVSRYLGRWQGAAAPLDVTKRHAAKRSVQLINDPNASQAAVYAGFAEPVRAATDHGAMALATAVIGGGYSARLNMEVRVKRGLSYGANAHYVRRRAASAVIASAQTRAETACAVLKIFEETLASLPATPPSESELSARKASLIGQYGRDIETCAGLAERLSAAMALGRQPDDVARFQHTIEAIGARRVTEAARAFLDPGRFQAVIVGDARAIEKDLARHAPDYTVVDTRHMT